MVCGVDMWDTAIANYSVNFPEATTRTTLLEELCPSALRDQIGDIDVLLTSPECTNHTCARGAAPRSEESRATALETVRFAKVFEPEWVVLENVIHMRPWSRYEELKEDLRGLGYNVVECTLDASDFGVAQKRRRLFLICRKKFMPVFQAPTKRRKQTAADILDPVGTWKTTPLYAKKRSEATLARAERAISALGHDEPFLIVYYSSDGSGGWQPLDRPLRTITTVDRFALVEKFDGVHCMRMLQVPELARAMGFTQNYRFETGTRRDQVKMIGNGVCPPVMESIIEAIIAQSA